MWSDSVVEMMNESADIPLCKTAAFELAVLSFVLLVKHYLEFHRDLSACGGCAIAKGC